MQNCDACHTDVEADELNKFGTDVYLCGPCFELNELAHEVGGTDAVRALLDGIEALHTRLAGD